MNHDLFLSEKQHIPSTAGSESDPKVTAGHLIDFIKTALLKVYEER